MKRYPRAALLTRPGYQPVLVMSFQTCDRLVDGVVVPGDRLETWGWRRIPPPWKPAHARRFRR